MIMKTKIKFWSLLGFSAAMLLGLSNCSNEDAGGDTGKTQSLVIKLPDYVVSASRAVENQWADQKPGEIENVRVYLLNQNSMVIQTTTFSGSEITAQEKYIPDVPGSVCNVILVANISSEDDAVLSGLHTAVDITNYPFSANSQNDNAIGYKTLIGEGVPSATGATAGSPEIKEVVIELHAITARMEVGTVRKGRGIESVDLVGVWINKVYANGAKVENEIIYHKDGDNVWGISPDAASGSTPFDASIDIPAYYPAAYFNSADNDAVKAVADGMAYSYHVFAGNNVPHLILLVKGEYAEGYYTDSKYFLKWVTFTRFISNGSAINSVDANQIYKIGVTSSGISGSGDPGIVINAEDLTESPELPLFDLGINVNITPWTAKYVTPSVQ